MMHHSKMTCSGIFFQQIFDGCKVRVVTISQLIVYDVDSKGFCNVRHTCTIRTVVNNEKFLSYLYS